MKSLQFTIVALLVFTSSLFAQNTTIKLPTTDSTSRFVVTDNSNKVLWELYGTGAFYMVGSLGVTGLPALGSSVPRLMWEPRYGAFRAGFVTGTQWDDANTGSYSTAMGYNTTASATGSTALGYNATASAIYATALGLNTVASGNYSTAMGDASVAGGNFSTAIGEGDSASNTSSTAMGNGTRASGLTSTAMGQSTTASGAQSTAMGYSTTASGGQSTAIGAYVSTGGYEGSCIIGDYSTSAGPTTTTSTVANQMMMRFAGGYILYTNSGASIGVSVAASGNSWSSVSDSTKKENIAKADGEYFLQSISQLRLGSWNYKKQDPQHYRHYGPMAQEIFHYFGKDTYGTIGNDTTLASADMDGIEMICLQALEKRTSELQKATANISELEKTVSEQQKELASRDEDIEQLKSEFIQLKKEIAAMNELKPSSAHASLTSADLLK